MSRLLTVGTGVGSLIGGNELLLQDVTVDFIGVPVNVLVACAAGAFAGFGFADNTGIPRMRQIQMFVGCIIVGAAATATADWLVGELTDMEVKRGVLSAMGALISCFMRYLIPEVIKRLGPWLDKIPFLKPEKQEP